MHVASLYKLGIVTDNLVKIIKFIINIEMQKLLHIILSIHSYIHIRKYVLCTPISVSIYNTVTFTLSCLTTDFGTWLV